MQAVVCTTLERWVVVSFVHGGKCFVCSVRVLEIPIYDMITSRPPKMRITEKRIHTHTLELRININERGDPTTKIFIGGGEA